MEILGYNVMFSKIFINRPRFAVVISLIMILGGLICFYKLPVEEYPQIAPPCIMVMAFYPGASSQVIADTVAAPLESEINSVEDLIYFSSQSDNLGNYTLLITFKSGTDEDMALVNVNNAVKIAEHSLPTEVVNNGIIVVKRSSDILAVISLYSDNPEHDALFLNNYASINVKDAVTRISGVGQSVIFCEMLYSMRVWLDPQIMRALSIDYSMVITAIQSQNVQAATGSVGTESSSNYMQFKVDTTGRLKTPEEFRKIVIKSGAEGRQVLLGDIAKVELGSEDYLGTTYYRGHPSIAMAIFKLSNANALEVMSEVTKTMNQLEKQFPSGLHWDFGYDSTIFVKVSMNEIYNTLLVTFLLVVVITYIFLQDWRATIVPSVTIPVSLIGTFFCLYLFGMSINTLTMFALILVIGSVVDNAICVTENCMRLIEEEHMTPYNAAVLTMEQLSTVLIATTFVVVSVYAPIGFYGGMVGTIYAQFAVTMCVALILSTINALTLSPALCALILRPHKTHKGFFKYVDFVAKIPFKTFNVVLNGIRSVFVFLAHPIIVILFPLILWANYHYYSKLPSAFLPAEDKGQIICEATLPSGASLPRTEALLQEVIELLGKIPGIEKVLLVPGDSMTQGSAENLALIMITLEDWTKRTTPELQIEAIQHVLRQKYELITDASLMVFTPPAIMGLGNAGGVSFALQATGDQTYKELAQTANHIVRKIMETGKAKYAFCTFEANTPMLHFDLDRAKAEALNVPVSSIFNTLQTQLGSIYVNDFNKYGKTYKVKVQSQKRFRENINSIGQLYVTSAKGEQIPIAALGNLKWTLGSRQTERFNMFPAATIQTDAIPFVSSGEMMNLIENIVSIELDKSYQISWKDMSYQEKQNSGRIVYLLAFALVMAYLFLVAQYESWTLPISVILSVATATLGGICALYYYKMDLNIYCQLGLLMLIGLTAKTSILLVEFAKQERDLGKGIREAAKNALKIRFRAIQMTALSFVIGVLPLLYASGAGSIARHSVGVTTFWGMLIATTLGMLFIPGLYVCFQVLGEGFLKIFRRKE